jgi:putative membrane protein
MKRKTLFLAAVPFLVVNGFFVANMTRYPELRKYADRPELAIVSAIFVVVFALPSFLATLRWLGIKRGIAALAALGAFAFFIETVALNTGIPYGAFAYGDKIGAKLPGGVPWTVAFAWAPLVLGAYYLAHEILLARVLVAHQKSAQLRARFLIPLTALLSTIFDGVLDPGAVSQNFWRYVHAGAYYGVPASNYFGWLLSGAVGAAILNGFARSAKAANPPSMLLGSAFLILTFWTSIAFFARLWIPFALGLLLLFLVARHFLFSASTRAASREEEETRTR